MNTETLSKNKELTAILDADECAAADYESLVALIADVAYAGHGTTELLASARPILEALKRCGVDPVYAVESAKLSGIIRAMHRNEGDRREAVDEVARRIL